MDRLERIEEKTECLEYKLEKSLEIFKTYVDYLQKYIEEDKIWKEKMTTSLANLIRALKK
jgi:hypothetical protein